MATKEEYIKALNGMVEVYDNLDGCMSAINIFNEGVHLLTGLVNEHFEEKTETNLDHFKQEILEKGLWNLAVVKGRPKRCDRIKCIDCELSKDRSRGCHEKVMDWLKKPYQKPAYKLTKFEYDLIQTYRDCNNYCKLSDRRILRELKDKGYFMDVDYDTKIQDILANCEAIK